MEISNLGRFVCLVGANGTGKSSILDMIVQIYSEERGWAKFVNLEWKGEVRGKKIRIDIAITDKEKSRLDIDRRLIDTFSSDNGENHYKLIHYESAGSGTLAKSFDDVLKSKISHQVIYYNPNRSFVFPHHTNLERPHVERDAYRTSKTTSFQARANLLSFQLANLLIKRDREWAVKSQESADTEDRREHKGLKELEDIFNRFFKVTGKKIGDPVPGEGTYSFYFEVPWSDDPIPLSQLSSGEQWILLFFTEMALNEWMNHIILIDEIETHLHPKMTIRFIDELKSQENDNQYWLTTHSPIIARHINENVFGLVLDNETYRTQCSRFTPEWSNLIESLTGGHAWIPTSKSIVLLEGDLQEGYKYSTDQTFFAELAICGIPPHPIEFISVGHSASVKGFHEALQPFESHMSLGWKIYAIRDRDALSDEQRKEMIDEGKGKFWIWNLGSLEGYMINPVLLAKYFTSIPISRDVTPTEISTAILDILKNRESDINTRFENQLVYNRYPKRGQASIRNLALMDDMLEEIQKELDEFKIHVKHQLSQGNWKELLPFIRCKDLLCILFDRYGLQKPTTAISISDFIRSMFRDVIALQGDSQEDRIEYIRKLWPEIVSVLETITAGGDFAYS